MMEDSGRGYRRVVPTPRPLEIIEHDTISELLDSGSLVIAVGGGGIPVVRENGRLSGIEAVIDKDLASALLAEEIGADVLLILTGVEKVAVDYGKPTQRDIDRMTAAEARALMAEGQFPPGEHGAQDRRRVRIRGAIRRGRHNHLPGPHEGRRGGPDGHPRDGELKREGPWGPAELRLFWAQLVRCFETEEKSHPIYIFWR